MLVAHIRDYGTSLRHILAHIFGTRLRYIMDSLEHA
jgi:hypothetical protein